MGTPSISFIVPVYNTRASLPRCLDSLLAQSFGDIEIIVINDGSPDGVEALIAQYAIQDRRVRTVSKKNGGLSSARNAGLAEAQGRIIDFVDSDDYVESNLAQRIVEVFDSKHPEIVIFGAECEPAGECPKRVQELLSPEDDVFEEFRPELLFDSHAQPYVWRAAYSREFIEREYLSFAENIRFAEDVVFQFESYPLSHKTVLISDKLYHYVMQGDSLTHTFNTSSSRLDKLNAHLLVLEEVLVRWSKRGLIDLCPGETITWYLDLVAFDLIRLRSGDQTGYCRKLSELLSRYFGVDWIGALVKPSVSKFATKVADDSGKTHLAVIDAVRLYLSTRGLKACLERFI